MTAGETLLRQMLGTIRMPVKASYTVKECCELLQIGRSTLYRLCKSGALQHVPLRRSVRISFAGLADYLTRHSTHFLPAG